MNGFLLDTNVLSEFNRRGEPDGAVRRWLEDTDPPGRRRAQLEQWLVEDLREWFEGRILPVDQTIADEWGHVRAEAQKNGRAIPVIDGLLAVTARRNGLAMVSRNVGDFEIDGLKVINPWQPA